MFNNLILNFMASLNVFIFLFSSRISFFTRELVVIFKCVAPISSALHERSHLLDDVVVDVVVSDSLGLFLESLLLLASLPRLFEAFFLCFSFPRSLRVQPSWTERETTSFGPAILIHVDLVHARNHFSAYTLLASFFRKRRKKRWKVARE